MKQSSRREFLVAAGILWQQAVARAQQHPHEYPSPNVPYRFVFFDQPRRNTLRDLMARIIPADERSSGAIGSRTDEYIDFILSHADEPLQQAWRTGLDRYDDAISGKSPEQIDVFLSRQARNEFAPATDDERFFALLKAAVTEGFYTSQEGIEKELGYQGMTFLLDFPGCTDTEHKIPAGYKPALRERQE